MESFAKFERGNSATDYTESYEDTQKNFEDKITGVRETISEQSTEMVNTCNAIIMQALSSYTETGDFETFKQSTESQLKLLSDSMTLKFTQATEKLEKINGELQGQLNKITKVFTFDINGFTIGNPDNTNKIIIDDDEFIISVNGEIVQNFDALGRAFIPELYITRKLNALGVEMTKDEANSIINIDLVGGV